MGKRTLAAVIVCGLGLALARSVQAQAQAAPSPQQASPAPGQAQPAPGPAQPATQPAAPPPGVPKGVTPPPDYVIGPGDKLAIVFWREKDLSVEETVVRPDGLITIPVLNDIQAGGLTPDQLRVAVEQAASRYVETPTATVVVKDIQSRRFYVTGMVSKPGPYPLLVPTTVLQAIAMAGGLLDFAKENDVVVMRLQGGKTTAIPFRYKDVVKGKNLQQNIELKPGDTIVVP